MTTIEKLTFALVIANGVLVLVTGVYAWLTHKIVQGGKETNASLKGLVKKIEEGQELQNEANTLKFIEIIGSRNTAKGNIEQNFPRLYQRWRGVGKQ